MGEGVGRQSLPPFSFIETKMDENCALYMNLGMSYEEYWNGPLDMVNAYALSAQKQRERDNYLSWLQGRYIYDALLCASPIFGFSKRKKPYDYLEEPYQMRTVEDEREEMRKNTQTEHASNIFDSLAKVFNKQRVKGERKDGDDL